MEDKILAVLKDVDESSIEKLTIYEEGKIYLQNLSSMLPPLLLEPEEKKETSKSPLKTIVTVLLVIIILACVVFAISIFFYWIVLWIFNLAWQINMNFYITFHVCG